MRKIYEPAGRTAMVSQASQRLRQAGLASPVGGRPEDDERQRRRTMEELGSFAEKQVRSMDKINQSLDKRLDKVKRLREEEERLRRAGEDTARVKEKIERSETRIDQLKRTQAERGRRFDQAMDARDTLGVSGGPAGGVMSRMIAGYGAGGIGGAARAGMGVARGAIGAMGGPVGAGLAVAGVAAGVGARYATTFAPMLAAEERVVQEKRAQEAQRAIFDFRSVEEGTFLEMAAFDEQRGRSLDTAEGELRARRRADTIRGVTGAFSAARGDPDALRRSAALAGRAMGAVGLSTAFTDRAMAGLQAEQEAFGMEMFERDFQARRMQDPGTLAALRLTQQDAAMNIGLQRALGLSDEGLLGPDGLMGRGLGMGLSREQISGAAQGILGAGGSTRVATDSAGLAAGLGRGMDLTNAAQVMGALSSVLGDTESSESAMINILSRGVRLGLDDSEFVAENRKFTELAAGFIQQAGAVSPQDAARAAASFEAYLSGQPTMRELQGAAGAADFMRGATVGQGGTPTGAAFQFALSQDERTARISPLDRAFLDTMSLEQIQSADPRIQSIAEQMGVSPEEAADILRNAKLDSIAPLQEVRDRIQGARGIDDLDSPEGRAALGSVAMGLQATYGTTMDQQTATALARRVVAGEVGIGDLDEETLRAEGQRIRGISEDIPGDRIGDQIIASAAERQNELNKIILSYADTVETAVERVRNSMERLVRESLELAGRSTGDNVTDYIRGLQGRGVESGVLRRGYGQDAEDSRFARDIRAARANLGFLDDEPPRATSGSDD